MGTVTRTLWYPARSSGSHDYFFGSGPGSWASSLAVSLTRTRTGSAVSNWRHKIATDQSATSGLSAVWESGTDTVGKAKVDYFGRLGNPSIHTGYEILAAGDLRRTGSTVTRGPKVPSISTTFADNMASAKFYRKLRQQSVQWSGPTFIGELREAMRMIRRPASALYQSSWKYLDSAGKQIRRLPRDKWDKRLSGLWLEYSFGWIPLIKDTEDAIKALDRLLTSNTKKSVIVGSFSDKRDTSNTLPANERYESFPQFGSLFMSWVPTHSVLLEQCIVRYKAKVVHEPVMTKWDNYALFGFTPSELVPAAWELLPWSFLVDYFANVGDVLQSWVTEAPKVAFVNKTVLRSTKYYGVLVPDAGESRKRNSIHCTQAAFSNVISPSWDYQRKEVSRSAASGVPLPRLQFKFNLGLGQQANIAALLAQATSLHPQRSFGHFRR